jgi:hypothetical protein
MPGNPRNMIFGDRLFINPVRDPVLEGGEWPAPRTVGFHSPGGGGSKWPIPVQVISLLENGEWLDRVDETFSKQLQHVSKVFHICFGR